jgi:hypothetical protein
MKSRYDVIILGAGHPPSPRLRRGMQGQEEEQENEI